MFNGDDNNEVIDWFEQQLVHPILWECPHPDDLPGPEDSATFDEMIKGSIRNLGLRVWDIQRNQYSTGYLTIRDGRGQKILLSCQADFILTDQAADEADFLFHTLVVIGIQSQPIEAYCEHQIQAYLLFLMNTSALQSVFGVLIYNDGRCRMYRATRDGAYNVQPSRTHYSGDWGPKNFQI
eukprot:CAMPEP_0170072496 /NCGR_PEP_ID=MMETSP0019_2-20121128/10122_1 /TAXON_ID=98059 /ORGANISM="Dinobryon sp., Strain UTEXLB2267" /LENGTH=180 /DNA_ID=CAMNT_0010281501 /DNA_START=417 /DNA_END=959 /DNA_ORIENTATION=+